MAAELSVIVAHNLCECANNKTLSHCSFISLLWQANYKFLYPFIFDVGLPQRNSAPRKEQ
jgi:hypothetical protein